MEKYDFLVVGGGFQGIVATALLRKQYKSVALLERGKALGGIMQGKEHNGLLLDFGCHLFNNDESDITALMLEILGDDYHPVDVTYAGVTNGHKQEEIAVPSFAFWPEEKKKKAFQQILDNAKKRESTGEKDYTTLYDWLLEHYGEIVTPEISQALKKSSGHDSRTLSADNIYKTQVACIHLLEDEGYVLPLKQEIKALDKVVALPSQQDQMRFYREAEKDFKFRTFYPSKNGMRGFGQAAESYFQQRDVPMLFGEAIVSIENITKGILVELESGKKIEAGKLVWTLDLGALENLTMKDNKSAEYLLKVPTTLFYYFINKENVPAYTYMHDFSPETKTYRVSAAGFYGNQYNDKGQSYICVEVPGGPETDLWQNPSNYTDVIWDEIRELGMIDLDKPEDVFHLSTPVTFPMYKAGYKSVQDSVHSEIAKKYPNIVNVNMNAYTKNDIVRVISKALGSMPAAA